MAARGSAVDLLNSINGRRRKTLEPKSVANALATLVGYASTIQVNLGIIEVAELPANYAKIQRATKIRILLFSQSTVEYSREEENAIRKTSFNA
jgi:hypothetical protein